MAKRPPRRGDLVEVDWVDIWEDPTGDPDEAKLSRRQSVGLYWGEDADEATGIETVVTTTTKDSDNAQCGYCCYLKACVVSIKILKRARTK